MQVGLVFRGIASYGAMGVDGGEPSGGSCPLPSSRSWSAAFWTRRWSFSSDTARKRLYSSLFSRASVSSARVKCSTCCVRHWMLHFVLSLIAFWLFRSLALFLSKFSCSWAVRELLAGDVVSLGLVDAMFTSLVGASTR